MATQHCMSYSQHTSHFQNYPYNLHNNLNYDSCVTHETRNKIFCAWKKPPLGFVAVNCDGSCRPDDGNVGYGVIIRNQYGEVLAAKAKHEKKSSEELRGPVVLMVELMAIRDGIELAGKKGFRCLEVQSDSKKAVNIVNDPARCPKECTNVLKEVLAKRNEFFKEDFRCVFVYREANRAADFLSKFLTSDGEKSFLNPDPLPCNLWKIVKQDVSSFEVGRCKKY